MTSSKEPIAAPSHGAGFEAIKRGADVLVSAIALAFLAVPLLLVALVIKMHDGGPALYRQQRIGRSCRSFNMYKFRSMVLDADRLGGFATAANDSRITPVGRFIRRTSIDELPQLMNVLLGDMSLIGPRPDVPAQETLYKPADWQLRHKMRPGLTGLAQATGRSTASADERTALDLAYIRSASTTVDLEIIFKTLKQLVARTGN